MCWLFRCIPILGCFKISIFYYKKLLRYGSLGIAIRLHQTYALYTTLCNEAISFIITIYLERKASATARKSQTKVGCLEIFLVKQECLSQATRSLCIAKISRYMPYLFPKVMSPKHCHRFFKFLLKIEQFLFQTKFDISLRLYDEYFKILSTEGF